MKYSKFQENTKLKQDKVHKFVSCNYVKITVEVKIFSFLCEIVTVVIILIVEARERHLRNIHACLYNFIQLKVFSQKPWA